MPTIKFSKTVLDRLPHPVQGQIDYWDENLKGFGLTVGAKTKTYFVYRRVNGSKVKVKIESHNVMTLDQARDKAKQLLIDMKAGTNPNTEKKKNQDRGITLQKAYEEYVSIRKTKEHTQMNDRSFLKCHLSDWLNKPIADITTDMVSKKHLAICKTGHNTTANSTLRLFRRIYNFVKADRQDTIPANPVNILTAKKQWSKTRRRQTTIKDNDLSLWFNAVLSLDNLYMKNYLLLQLFTGMRKNEGLGIRWEHVDMKGKTFTIPETKTEKALTLPMSSYLSSIFKELQAARLNEYVFPELVKGTKTGHMSEPKRQVRKVKDKTGIEFCLHDQRRTFKTIAQDTVTISENHFLTNHSTGNAGDGYIIMTVEKVREPMQKITDKILALAGRDKNGKPRSIYIGMNRSVRARLLKALQQQIRKARGGYYVAYRQQRHVFHCPQGLQTYRITCKGATKRRP
jgi:integrase